MLLLTVLLGSFSLLFPVDANAEWGYRLHPSLPPSLWYTEYPLCADTPENRQSPIMLEPKQCVRSSSAKPFKFSSNFYRKVDFEMKNNGHTIRLDPKEILTVTGGHLIGKFKFAQVHFHWGSAHKKDKFGSEHRFKDVFDQEYPTAMEMHIVLNKADEDIATSITIPDHVAVIGVLFENEKLKYDHRRFNKKSKLIRTIKTIGMNLDLQITPAGEEGDSSPLEFIPRDLLPYDNPVKFINYDGSLTTPPCSPVVQWHLVYPPLSIPANVLEKFTKLEFDTGNQMLHNERPLQQRHGRELRCFTTKLPDSSEETNDDGDDDDDDDDDDKYDDNDDTTDWHDLVVELYEKKK